MPAVLQSNVTSLQVDGFTKKVGTPIVTVLKWNPAGDISEAQGATVPTDTDAGYAKGCVFIKTDGGVGSTLFLNEGSATSADFNAK